MTAPIATVRQQNLRALFQLFVAERVAAGDPPKGIERAFALQLQVGVSTLSLAKSGSRPIGDRLARQFESGCGKPSGWLDEAREPEGPSPAEQAFLALALKAYRGCNAEGRRRLRQVVKDWPGTEPGA